MLGKAHGWDVNIQQERTTSQQPLKHASTVKGAKRNFSLQTQSFLSLKKHLSPFFCLIKWDILFHEKQEPTLQTLMTPSWECGLLKVHKRREDRRRKERRAREHNGPGVPFSQLRALSHFNTLACVCHYRKGFTMCVREWRKCSKLLSQAHTHAQK